jgi:hypothetical protein
MSKNGRGGRRFDMAGEKFDMPSGPGTLVASTMLLVNLQPAQTGSAMSSCCHKRRAEARRWHSARQNLRNGRSNIYLGLGTIRHVLDIKKNRKLGLMTNHMAESMCAVLRPYLNCSQRQSVAVGGYAIECGAVKGLAQGFVCKASLVSQVC